MGILSTLAINLGAAPGWLAEGETREISIRDGSDRVTSEWQFRFFFQDCRWEMAIATRELGYAISTQILYDGTNITTLSAGGGTYQSQRFENQAARYQQAIPPFGGQAAFVWLALGSACELADRPSEFKEVVFTEFEHARTAPVIVSLQSTPPALPESLLFLSPDNDLKTNALYRVLSFTNRFSVFVPSHFQMDVLDALGTTVVRYEGFVTNLSMPASVSSELALPPKTLVTDLRFAKNSDERGFDYMTNKWLSRAQAKRRPEFRDETKLGNAGGTWMIFLLLILIVTISVISFSHRMNPKPKTEEAKNEK